MEWPPATATPSPVATSIPLQHPRAARAAGRRPASSRCSARRSAVRPSRRRRTARSSPRSSPSRRVVDDRVKSSVAITPSPDGSRTTAASSPVSVATSRSADAAGSVTSEHPSRSSGPRRPAGPVAEARQPAFDRGVDHPGAGPTHHGTLHPLRMDLPPAPPPRPEAFPIEPPWRSARARADGRPDRGDRPARGRRRRARGVPVRVPRRVPRSRARLRADARRAGRSGRVGDGGDPDRGTSRSARRSTARAGPPRRDLRELPGDRRRGVDHPGAAAGAGRRVGRSTSRPSRRAPPTGTRTRA